jgi:hypothetical protein
MTTDEMDFDDETPEDDLPEDIDEDELTDDLFEEDEPEDDVLVGVLDDDDDDEPAVGDDKDDDDDEDTEALDDLEAEELDMLTDDEASETIAPDEEKQLRDIRRAQISIEASAAGGAGANEFVCSSCYLVKKTSQLASKRRKICLDCAG